MPATTPAPEPTKAQIIRALDAAASMGGDTLSKVVEAASKAGAASRLAVIEWLDQHRAASVTE